jgi:predicted esterase
MNICIEDRKTNGMSTIEMYDIDIVKRVPMVILIHDFGGNKEDMIGYGYRFAREGFFTVAFDLFNHGDLAVFNKKNNDYFNLNPNDLIKIFVESTNFINSVIGIYESNLKVMSNKIGLIGFSFGGSVVYNYITGSRRPNIKAAVPVISSPNVINFVNKMWSVHGNHNFLGKTDIDYLGEIQPSNNMSSLKNFPLLIMNNINDDIASIQDVRKSHEEAFFNYTNQDLLKFVEYRDGGHTVKPEMTDESVSWFKNFLFTN